jgi:hypothetical protein
MNEISTILKRIEKMKKKKCRACGKVRPHQVIDGDLVCWDCGEY